MGRRALGSATAILLALGVAGGLAACGGSDGGEVGAGDNGAGSTTAAKQPAGGGTQTTAPTEPTVETIVLRDGEPVGGVQELEYSAGDEVDFAVRSDVADEIHVHGYDVTKEVEAGSAVSFSFPAEIEGIFEIESHESGGQIAELRVSP